MRSRKDVIGCFQLPSCWQAATVSRDHAHAHVALRTYGRVSYLANLCMSEECLAIHPSFYLFASPSFMMVYVCTLGVRKASLKLRHLN